MEVDLETIDGMPIGALVDDLDEIDDMPVGGLINDTEMEVEPSVTVSVF